VRATEQQEVPKLLDELAPEQFAAWRHHPVTKLVFDHYLVDFRANLERGILNSWLAAKLTLQAEQESKGHILASHMVQSLTLDHILTFYNMPIGDGAAAKLRRPQTNAAGY
jgi:hypothetical protein